VRNSTLHAILEAFTSDAASRLQAETVGGAEVPFEVTEERGGRARLYCYRPLTGVFIDDRLMMLRALPTYAPAVRALADLESVGAYLRQRGEQRVPGDPRDRADVGLKLFLAAVFAERNQFGFEPRRFEEAYAELERALYDGRCLSTVIAPLLGIRLDQATAELSLGDGLSLMRGETLPDAPADAVWGDRDEPNVLATLSLVQERALRPPVSVARARFRRILTALRLFESGGYALGPIAWTRSDSGPWRMVPVGATGRPRFTTVISAAHEDELRGFFNLIAKRAPSNGELAWALARFEMGCERLAPFDALTDYLLALRALLEPEGPASGQLAQRLAAICATPEDRAALAERTARAMSLERAVIAGLAPAEPGADALVEELAQNLRALLRDMVCGHLDLDVRRVADELLQEAVAAPL
jgi:hypothetical protein